MKYQKYVSLIKNLETYAEKNPQAYQYRVAGLALLGYVYIIGLILLCILLPLAVLATFILKPDLIIRAFLPLLKLWWILLPGAAVFFSFLTGAIRSLTAKVPEPVGNELRASDAPEVFEFVEKTCDELKAQRPEKILVNDDFNASVVTMPRFGIFGRKVYLNLGLPLMYALSPEQFKAVLTHEIGHISGKHGSFSKWAYQLHETWNRFIESQELQNHKLSALYEKFVNWFFPYFTAYSFVLMRRHEREADDYAVQLIGAKPLGEALINLETKGSMLSQNFWQEVFEENARQDKPPTELFSRMALAFRKQDAKQERESLIKFIDIKTDYSDTHPSLADRLKFIGYWKEEQAPRLPDPVQENAAEVFLGKLLEKYTRQFNDEWQERMSKNWKANHEYLQSAQKRLAELDEKEELSPEELFEKARLVAEKRGSKEALPIIHQLLEVKPDHAEGNYALGGILLENNDERGFEYLNKAMELEPRLRLNACETAFNYLRLKGRHEEAKPYIEAIENEQEILQKAENERRAIYPTDNYETHSLPDETVAAVVKKISYHEEIEAAYLVKKAVQFYPEVPLHVLFLTVKSAPSKGGVTVGAQDLLDIIGNQVGEFGIQFIYAFGGKDAQYARKIEAVENSKIFGS